VTVRRVGVVGLGHMGSVLAANLVSSGLDVVTHDIAGSINNPRGAVFAATIDELARHAAVVVCSLPDGAASEHVARAIVRAEPRATACVVDTSTIGVAAARRIDGVFAAAGTGYVDAPVSGGVAGARSRTLSVMYAGADAACQQAAPVLAALSDRCRRVGVAPGHGQALKLANNFLSAVALAATSEAVAFGVAEGLDMAMMLEVLNASSGQSQATTDKFPTHVLTGRYAAGFANTLMAKDLRLYLEAVTAQRGAAGDIAPVTASVWERFAVAEPDADFTRIYPFLEHA
jgi:3-hydroxyisobutyrate dehydrogenase